MYQTSCHNISLITRKTPNVSEIQIYFLHTPLWENLYFDAYSKENVYVNVLKNGLYISDGFRTCRFEVMKDIQTFYVKCSLSYCHLDEYFQ